MNKIKKYFKKFFHRTDLSGLTVFGRGQTFDWEILLIFFLLLVIIMLSFSVHVFLGVRAGDIFQNNNQAPVHSEVINRKALDQVISSYNTRSTTLKNLQTQKPVFVDPSL